MCDEREHRPRTPRRVRTIIPGTPKMESYKKVMYHHEPEQKAG